MKRLFLILFVFISLSTDAQSLRSLFVEMPDSLLPLLTRSNREDCIDFMDANMVARVTNRLDGTSELKALTADYLLLSTSAASEIQMRLLPFAGDTIVCVVNSVCAEACDSRVDFYTRNWQPVEAALFHAPAIRDFFVPCDSLDDYIAASDIYLVRLSLSADSDSMQAEFTMPAYMSRDDAARIVPHLQPIRYRWDEEKGFVSQPR